MNIIERCQLANDRGFTYDKYTGIIYNRYGKIVNCKLHGYICINITYNRKKFNISGHQFAWYLVYGYVPECIDHIDKNKSNNIITNLRSVTRQENSFNTNAKGYSFHIRDKKWDARIGINGKLKHIGRFDTELEAYNAYIEVKNKYHLIS